MATTKKDNIKTLVIDKWNGHLTRFSDGDINSGQSNYLNNWGTDTFNVAGNLSFYQVPVDITGGVITDMIMSGKVRVESGITYVYAIGHLARLYKIQVNNLSTKNPDYDTPVLLATLGNSQTFQYGASLDFAQLSGTERIWIGHDTGATRINFDGSNETNYTGGSWQTYVPRQQIQFAGSIYFTNGSNLAQIDSTETVVTYAKLSPGFPSNTQARALGSTVDGRYMVIVVTRNAIGNQTLTTPDTNQIAAMPSSLVYWNGIDTAATASTSFPSFTVTNYFNFSQAEYVFGFQIGGAQISTVNELIMLLEFDNPPLANAVGSSGDFIGWASTFWDINTETLKAAIYIYGVLDPREIAKGLYRQLFMSSSLTGGDIIRIPCFFAVSSIEYAGLSAGYSATAGTFGTGKVYFSTLEFDGSTTKYGFYMFKSVSDYLSSSIAGVYETQHQIFSQKVKATEVRVYFNFAPTFTTGVSFQIDLIGIDGNVISGTTKVFTPVVSDGDRLKYNPNMPPTSCIGLRITNAGTVTPVIHKVEVDYEQMGN